ncbi:MAG: glycosyltransferase [Rhodospirillales bacterium]|nr:glycosyltransferase [Rhodospirillales bacterium]
MQSPKTIVTLTPIAVDRDSRSVRIASSFARHGYRSIVVQNCANQTARPDYPFKLLTFQGSRGNEGQGKQTSTPGWRTCLIPAWIREVAHFARFFLMYLLLRPIQGLFLIPKADLIYLHEYRLFPTARLIAFFRNIPIIYDAHDFYPEVWDATTLSPFWRCYFLPFLMWLEKWCIGHAATVVTVGKGVARLIEHRYDHIPIILHNSHDPRLERKPATTLRTLAGLSDNQFLIAVIGNLKPGMAITPLLQAAAQLDENIHIAFVGRNHEKTRREIEAANLTRRVHVVGAVQPEEIALFCKDADAALLPYFSATRNVENIAPNGFFNALAAGLPLLYPHLPELIEIIGDHKVGLEIDPLDPKTISRAIQKFQHKGEALKMFSDNARSLSNSVSWENDERVLIDHVTKLISSNTIST